MTIDALDLLDALDHTYNLKKRIKKYVAFIRNCQNPINKLF